MTEKVIYSNNGGLGVVLENENESDVFDLLPVVLHGITIKPNDYTDLDGMFIEPIRYVGLLKGEDIKVMCFCAGKETTLFNSTDYYYCFYWIDEFRIATKYREGSARDYKWINGKWK